MARLVLKFGGSSVAQPEQIKSIARKIAELHHAGNEMIIVVSAMGKTTDGLTELAYQISPNPNRRELDMLISTGERVSMSLMSMALHDLNAPSISLTGSQAGLMTDNSFSNAKILDVKPIRVEESLRAGKIVVLAGFQGVNPDTKEITTLGRGGSDTTAVAFAAHIQADRCEILKDVDGIYSCDPKLSKTARLYERLPIRVAAEMCFWGAKVLNYRSVELALRKKVKLFVGRSDNFKLGTELVEEDHMYEQYSVAGVTTHKEVHHAHITCTDSADGYNTFGNLLRENQLPSPQILASAYDSGVCRLMYTGDGALLKSIQVVLQNSSKAKTGAVLASVTVTCFGGVNNESIEKNIQKLKAANIIVLKTVHSALSTTYLIEPQNVDKAIQLLHS